MWQIGGMDISEQSVRAHYGELLGVGEQWEVVRVEIDHAERRVEAWASWRKGESRCHTSSFQRPAQATTCPRGPWCCCLPAILAS